LVDRRSDIFGLGAILYAILTGQPPYSGPDTMRRALAYSVAPPRSLARGVPVALEAVCLKAMARLPEERYQSAQDLAKEVERWLADEPVSAWREPLRVRAGRWSRRNQALVGAAAALVGAAAGLGLVGFLLGGVGALVGGAAGVVLVAFLLGGAFWAER
jgi:serine/threonine protein kinase